VAAACRGSTSYLDVLSALEQASSDLLQHGQSHRMRSTLQLLIEQLLPDNAHELCSSSTPHGAPSTAAAQALPVTPNHHAVGHTQGTGLAQAPCGETETAPQYMQYGTTPARLASAPRPAAVPAPFVLSATRVRGPCPVCWRGDPVEGGFESKAYLIDRLLAGAHELLESDGRWFARRRGKRLVDGGEARWGVESYQKRLDTKVSQHLA
jgi:hypothetical protein